MKPDAFVKNSPSCPATCRRPTLPADDGAGPYVTLWRLGCWRSRARTASNVVALDATSGYRLVGRVTPPASSWVSSYPSGSLDMRTKLVPRRDVADSNTT